MKIGIVGLGLIGGSFAKGIKAHTMHTVYGTDREEETMLFSRLSGATDGTLDDSTLSLCDLVLVALCPEAAVQWVEQHDQQIKTDAIVVDLCGVKRFVTERLEPLAASNGFFYVGGHPMAGKERGGFVNATADLFAGASMVLVSNDRIRPEHLELLHRLFYDIGFAKITYTSADDHDRMIALTSQLAHLLSSAYVKSPEADRHRGYSAGSFRDMTRVARLDETMWTELFLHNRDHLLEQLDILLEHLTEYRTALAAADETELCRLLREGKERKARQGGN